MISGPPFSTKLLSPAAELLPRADRTSSVLAAREILQRAQSSEPLEEVVGSSREPFLIGVSSAPAPSQPITNSAPLSTTLPPASARARVSKEALHSARAALDSARFNLASARSARGAPLSARRAAAAVPTFRRTAYARAIGVRVVAGNLESGLRDGVWHDEATQSSLFDTPQSVCQLDADHILVADRNNCRIRMFTLSTGAIFDWAFSAQLHLQISLNALLC